MAVAQLQLAIRSWHSGMRLRLSARGSSSFLQRMRRDSGAHTRFQPDLRWNTRAQILRKQRGVPERPISRRERVHTLGAARDFEASSSGSLFSALSGGWLRATRSEQDTGSKERRTTRMTRRWRSARVVVEQLDKAGVPTMVLSPQWWRRFCWRYRWRGSQWRSRPESPL